MAYQFAWPKKNKVALNGMPDAITVTCGNAPNIISGQLDPACNSDKDRVRNAQARGLKNGERRIVVEECDGERRTSQLHAS
jgi:hypothetical protein